MLKYMKLGNKDHFWIGKDSQSSFVNFFSCLLVSFFLYVAYFIVSFLIVSLINSHFVFGFASLFISAMLFLTVS